METSKPITNKNFPPDVRWAFQCSSHPSSQFTGQLPLRFTSPASLIPDQLRRGTKLTISNSFGVDSRNPNFSHLWSICHEPSHNDRIFPPWVGLGSAARSSAGGSVSEVLNNWLQSQRREGESGSRAEYYIRTMHRIIQN